MYKSKYSPRKKRETARTARAIEICVGLTTQKYNWLTRELTVNNQNHWQVDDGGSTARMFVTFPENWHSKSRAKWSIGSSNLQSWCYCNFADWFWKKPDFSIVVWGKARFEPKYVHFSGCPFKPSIGEISVKWGGLAYTTPTVRGICTFAVFFSVSRPFMSLHSLRYKEKLEPLDHDMANFKRS